MTILRLTASSPYLQVSLYGRGRWSDFIGLIDTGASMTSVHPDVVDELEPQEIGAVDLRQVGSDFKESKHLTPTYYLQMAFDGASPPVGVEVVAAIPSSPCQILIGRDLISRWLMTVDGPGDQLLIAY